jgi:hypothetical protein
MAKQVKVGFRFVIQGDGVNITLSRQPLTSNADFSQVTSGAVNINSPAIVSKMTLQPGWNQILDPANYLTAPMVRNYLDFFPPATSVIAKTLAGSTTDTGVALAPNVPMRLALPAGGVTMYMFLAGATAETVTIAFE